LVKGRNRFSELLLRIGRVSKKKSFMKIIERVCQMALKSAQLSAENITLEHAPFFEWGSSLHPPCLPLSVLPLCDIMMLFASFGHKLCIAIDKTGIECVKPLGRTCAAKNERHASARYLKDVWQED
jgi:hypothetical protein